MAFILRGDAVKSATQHGRERGKRLRRRQILDAARGLFWERGYSATTVPEVAEAAQLAPGTIYLYFESKSALYAELLFEGYDLLLERLATELNRTARPRERAEGLADAFLGFARDYPEYFDVIFFVLRNERSRTDRSPLQDDQVERLQARETACKAVAARLLEEVGADRRSGDLQDTVDAVWSMLAGTVFYFRHAGPQRFDRVARAAKRLLLDALLPEG